MNHVAGAGSVARSGSIRHLRTGCVPLRAWQTGRAMTSLPLIPVDPDAPRPPAPRCRRGTSPTSTWPGRQALVTELGEPAFRAKQVSNHYFGRLVRDPAQMTDLPAATRERLAGALLPTLLTPVRELACDDGATRKALWRLHDGSLVESVLMGYPDRVTVCISSQAGCGMACPFCATGQAGLTRNLSTAEIVDQAVYLAGVAASGAVAGSPPRLSHVVFMGMGEPLANYSRVIAAIRRLVAPAPEGLGLSQRHITVSTVGLVPAIRRLASEDLSVTLALSLHAPDDDLRDELVPVNQRWKVAEVLDAAWDYAARDGASRVDRVRDDQGRERPAVASRPARAAAGRQAGPREPHPAQPDAGQPLGRQPEAGRAGVRPAVARRRGVRPRCGTPGVARSTARVGSSPPPRTGTPTRRARQRRDRA